MARRKLTPTEQALWRKVQKSVTPLKPQATLSAAPPNDPRAGAAAIKANSDAPKKRAGSTVDRKTVPAPIIPKPPVAAPMRADPLEPKLRRRLARGARDVDARLDLHGMRQHEARAVLERFLHDAQRRGARIVLVITGKGGGDYARNSGADFGGGSDGIGVLRSALPRWLALPAFRDLVVGCEEAGRRHGGAGAYYVRLRRPRGAA
ncbi:MAG: Smr/MutS family protein [Alphaproteobacteria bacterium]